MRQSVLAVAVIALVLLAGCGGGGQGAAPSGGGQSGGDQLGYAVGGAQDATAFRKNVREGYVPQPTDITYEGVFHDYYFETGQNQPCQALFCPSYSRAVTTDPLSNQTERYVTVGLNSNITKAAFERKKLNLVIVVDTSGSMSEAFNRYYYDDGERQTVESGQTKIDAAREAVATLTDHLREGDRLGVVTYDDQAHVQQELTAVGELDHTAFRKRIDRTTAGGSTNLDAGMRTATEMLRPYSDSDATEYETRVIYLTDAMPNVGETSQGGFAGRLQDHADDGVYTTVIGVGVDFNSRLVEGITAVKGANYYSVHSPSAFTERMDEGFKYMVTPLVFDLSLEMESDGYAIEQVYGTTNESASTGQFLHVKTLFPSKTEDNRTKGGVILLELDKVGDNPTMSLVARYEDRAGQTHRSTRTVSFEEHQPSYYESSGVRKAVTLSRYASLMRNWAAYERAQVQGADPETPADGVEHRALGTWEQQSVELRVSPIYAERIGRFKQYFRTQMDVLNNSRMTDDLDVLETVATSNDKDNETVAPASIRQPIALLAEAFGA